MSIHVEDGRDPDTEVRLTEELFAGLPVPVPDLTHDDGERPEWIVVARRPDGALLGWAQVYVRQEGAAEVHVQWVVVSRERERIVHGRNNTREVAPEEKAVVTHLLRTAADAARAAGHTALEWDDPERHLDAPSAAELGAAPAQELSRRWTLTPLAGWTPPAGLSDVRARPVPSSPDAELLTAYADFFTDVTGQPYTPEDVAELLQDVASLPYAALDLLTPDGRPSAQIIAVIEKDVAQADAIVHRGEATAGQLAGLLASLVTRLRQEHTGVTTLEVQDLGDPVVAEALTLMGLEITDHWQRYRLPL
ncbi:hypothetical protein ACFP1Z_12700 [Streptomyces gamaensis]|uniref:N-acetyltransferase n=1 Tax=Streptomyces gamaensis TaxID=1763542 RepID=A0ABW0YZU1_9ACTN